MENDFRKALLNEIDVLLLEVKSAMFTSQSDVIWRKIDLLDEYLTLLSV